MAFIDDFKDRFPEIDPTLADQLVPIYEQVYPCYYGGSYTVECDKEAILLLVAHMVASDPAYSGSGSSSPTKSQASKAVGSVSVSYAQPRSQSDFNIWLTSTRYGQLYLMVISNNIGGVFV